ncbi:MAG: hypothetical protein PHR68_03185, partial [Candidatus Gracilibacteria bacterium]|nr:hypothetical protein [Candidatus Gracilibacteria bacterium]
MNNTNNLEKNNENNNLIVEKLLQQEQKRHPGEKIKITEIKTGIYGIEFDTGNIAYYLNIEGNALAIHSRDYKLPGYSEKLEKLGYKEEKVGTEYVMTKLSDNSKVDKYSIEYFNIFVDLDFDFSLKYIDEAKTSKNRL